MLKRAMLAAVAACTLTVPATASASNPHETVEGTWIYVPTVITIDGSAGQQVFISGRTSDQFGGSFVGTGDQEFTLVHHANQQFNFYRGITEFEGAVADDDGELHEGAMTILTVGKQDPGLVDPSALPWEGTWVVTASSGGLEGVHGHGTFTGPSGFLTYEGTIQFTR